jgi:hypothetical protein
VVWYDDGTFVESRSAKGIDRGERGKGQGVAGKTSLVQLTDWLKRAPQVDVVAAIGFTVQPKGKP